MGRTAWDVVEALAMPAPHFFRDRFTSDSGEMCNPERSDWAGHLDRYASAARAEQSDGDELAQVRTHPAPRWRMNSDLSDRKRPRIAPGPSRSSVV